jgi:hypothetical protein
VEADEDARSPPQLQKRHSLRPSGTALSLNSLQRDIKEAFSRRCSSLRRRPVVQVPAPLPVTGQQLVDGHDVSILVTEPSPEGATPATTGSRPPLLRQQSEATVVHVLVHRESEEYRESREALDEEGDS